MAVAGAEIVESVGMNASVKVERGVCVAGARETLIGEQ